MFVCLLKKHYLCSCKPFFSEERYYQLLFSISISIISSRTPQKVGEPHFYYRKIRKCVYIEKNYKHNRYLIFWKSSKILYPFRITKTTKRVPTKGALFFRLAFSEKNPSDGIEGYRRVEKGKESPSILSIPLYTLYTNYTNLPQPTNLKSSLPLGGGEREALNI